MIKKNQTSDIVLAAINEVTKCDISKNNRYDSGVDISNMPPFNPYNTSHVLQDLGYEENEDGFTTNGWEYDYWNVLHHPDENTFPPMQISGTAFIHECHINGIDDDADDHPVYPHLEDNPAYADRVKHGYELLKASQFNRPKEEEKK